MDRSMMFFGELEALEKQIKTITKEGDAHIETLAIARENKRQYILKGMKQALCEEGYTLLVDDLAKFLDIDEKQVRSNIIPHVDYITAPEGSAGFFSIEENSQMTFLEMRIKKWKRLFIHKGSFEDFLTKHLVIFCPYTKIKWCENKNRLIADGEGETAIPYIKEMDMPLTRKSKISVIVREKKLGDLIRKTKNDITYARMLGLISPERLQEEMDYLARTKLDIDVPVHNQEIMKYIEKTDHYRLHLYKEETDKDKPLYCTKKKKEGDEVCIKPTVLYWFL